MCSNHSIGHISLISSFSKCHRGSIDRSSTIAYAIIFRLRSLSDHREEVSWGAGRVDQRVPSPPIKRLQGHQKQQFTCKQHQKTRRERVHIRIRNSSRITESRVTQIAL